MQYYIWWRMKRTRVLGWQDQIFPTPFYLKFLRLILFIRTLPTWRSLYHFEELITADFSRFFFVQQRLKFYHLEYRNRINYIYLHISKHVVESSLISTPLIDCCFFSTFHKWPCAAFRLCLLYASAWTKMFAECLHIKGNHVRSWSSKEKQEVDKVR